MRKIVALLVAGALGISACASAGLTKDCQARKNRMEQVAAIAAAELSPGLTTMQVRAILRQEPDEIITGRGLEGLETWRYYLFPDCKAHLGLTAPTTELIFLQGKLLKWKSFVE
jgi:hypothetical protein